MFKLSEELAGKTVKCKKCEARFVVPSVDGIASSPKRSAARVEKREEEEDDRPARKLSRSRRDDDDDDDGRPTRKSRSRRDDEDEDDDERPTRKSRSRRDDEDEDEDEDEDDGAPRRQKVRRKKGKSSSGMLVLGLLGGGALLLFLVCAGVGALVFFSGKGFGPAKAGPPIAVNFGADGVFTSKNVLNRGDPIKDNRRFKTYSIHMEAGKTYQIDMVSNDIDAYLYVLDGTGRIVAEDDDNGGALHARIRFTPRQTGDFRIETTSFEDRETGNFTLIVRKFG